MVCLPTFGYSCYMLLLTYISVNIPYMDPMGKKGKLRKNMRHEGRLQ